MLTSGQVGAGLSLHWQGPLMVSGDHPGALFAQDPNGTAQFWGCAPGLCLLGDGDGYMYDSVQPASGTWTRSSLPVTPPMYDVACASASFCGGIVDVGHGIRVSSSTDPTTAWSRPVTIARGAEAETIACPAAEECIVLTGAGELLWSDSVTVASSWHHAALAGARGDASSIGLACSGTGLCFARDAHGGTLVSTDPTAGASAWTAAGPPLSGNLPACASPQLCTFVTTAGQVYASTSPARAGSWQLQYQEPKPPTESPSTPGPLACSAPARCVGLGRDGRFLYSDDPAGGHGAWHQVGPALSGEAVIADESVSGCAGPDDCVIQTADDRTRVLVDPADPASWRTTSVAAPASGLDQLQCAGPALCVAVDAHGELQTSTAPLSGEPWTAVRLTQPVADAVCGSAELCAAVGRQGGLLVSGSPAGGTSAWRTVGGVVDRISAVACRGARFCAAVAADGRTYSSVDPLSVHGWRRHGPLPGFTAADRASAAISCVSRSACVITAGASVWSSRDPAAARSAWRRTALPVAPGPLSLTCPSTALCLARTSVGSRQHRDALVGHDPFSTASHWSARPGATGMIHCFGRHLCAEAIQPVRYERDAVLVNGHDGRGRWTVTFGSSIESDEPPYFVALNDVACVPDRFCLIATDAGAIIAGRFGPGRCMIYGGNDIGCRAVQMTDRRLRTRR